MILGLFRRQDPGSTIATLYGAIVAQARRPAFSAAYGVPDTISGRFGLIVLQLALVLRRLRREGEPARALGQSLFDHFCRDMDDNLREIGVGDLTVPREMRKMADAFYGRLAAYEAALAAASDAELFNTLSRNIFSTPGRSAEAGRLARYVAEAVRQLDEQGCAGFERGEIGFRIPTVSGVSDFVREAMTSARPWSVPVSIDEVPETGRRFVLSADARVCAEIAKLAQLRDLPRLQANFEVTRHGAAGLRVKGDVTATVGQTCVVTLEPLSNDVAEHVDLVFVPPGSATAGKGGHGGAAAADNDDIPETLNDGTVDLGAVATEFLLLGIDPYPRKSGVRFDAPVAPKDPSAHPFAALAALKKEKSGQ